MKTKIRPRSQSAARVAAAMAAISVGLISLNAADEKPAKKAAPTQEESMKAWMEAATPGAPHKLLTDFVGKWTTHTKMWMAPGAPPAESDGKAEAQMILGGRFVEMTQTGSMMGMPWEAKAITGYDNFRKAYQSLWMDNMGTAMVMTSGKASGDGKTFTYEGRMDEPATGEKDKAFTVVEKHVSKDEIVTELTTKVDGKDFKFLEATYKRSK